MARLALAFEKERLPEGWVRTKIQNITDVIRGASPRPKGDPRYFGGNIPWIMISDITREKGKFLSITKDHVTEEGMKKSRFLKKGSLILSNSGTVCIPKILNVSGCIHDGFVTFPTLSKNINIFYAYYWFENIRPKIIHDNKQGVTQVNLNTTIVKNIEMLIPPLSEQHRIVSKIESIFSQIDAKQKKLTIFENKIKFVLNNIHELKCSILTQTFKDLEDECVLKTLADVCTDIQAGFAQGEKNVKNGIIHLRMNNISVDFTMNFELLRTINATNKQKEKYSLEKNDVIFVNTNSAELVGKSALFDFDKLCLYSNHLSRLRADISVLNPKWLLYYLQFRWMKHDFTYMCNKWINQAAISNTKIKQLQIPIPSIEMQHRLVVKIESIFGKIDAEFIILKITYSVMIFVFLHLYARTAVFFDYLDPYSISSKHGSK